MIPFFAVAVTLAVPPAVRPDNPPVRVWIDPDRDLAQGDRVRVHIRTEQDAYVVVLRADGAGRVRVLFPLDPGDDDFVRGDKKIELRGRGGREAFFVDEQSGTGAVLAAASPTPFKFDEFVRGDHWDYRVLASDEVRSDPEAGLLELVRRMAGDQHFDYDVVSYTVGEVALRPYGYRSYGSSCFGCYGYRPWYGGSGFGFRLGFGSPYSYCDPFWDPFCDSFYYGYGYGYGYDPFYYGGFPYGPYCWWCGPRIVYRPRGTVRIPLGLRPATSGVLARRRGLLAPGPTPPFVLPRAPLGLSRPPVVARRDPVDRRQPEVIRTPQRRAEPSRAQPARGERGDRGGAARPRSGGEARPRPDGGGGRAGGGGATRSGGGSTRSGGGGGRRH